MPHETEKLEFKEIVKDDIYKEVIAFANTDGGTILIGINKAGDGAPIADIEGTYTRVTNGIRDTHQM